MSSRILCLSACALGICLLIASWYWNAGAGGKLAWTEEQAQAYNAAAGKLHQITYEHAASQNASGTMLGGMQRHVSDGELAAAKDAWETQKNERDEAIGFVDFWGNALFGLGVLLAMVGGTGFFIAKSIAEDK